MPHAPAEAVLSDIYPIATLPNAIIFYYPEEYSYSIYSVSDVSERIAIISPGADYVFLGSTMYTQPFIVCMKK